MPRKKIEIDWKVLDAILAYSPSLVDCEEKLGCSHDVIERAIKKKFKMTFSEYKNRKMSNTRLKLVQTALGKAYKGDNVMLIFCLKNLCNWSDKVEIEEKTSKPFKFTYNPISKKINTKKAKDKNKKITTKKKT